MVTGKQPRGEVPERWSAKAKTEVVLRLLRGEAMMAEFIERYNTQWLLERHGHRTPAEVRQALTLQAAA